MIFIGNIWLLLTSLIFQSYYVATIDDVELFSNTAASKVTVIGARLIEQRPFNKSVLIGSNIRMPCTISDEYSRRHDVTVVWLHNGQEIPSSGDSLRRISLNEDNSLSIAQVGPENIGTYTCVVRVAENETDSASASLRLIEKPSMPQDVTAKILNNTLPTKIKVSWTQGFDGNSPITKHVLQMSTIGSNGLWSDWDTVVDNIPLQLCCSIVIDNVKPSEEASFRVIASNGHGAGKPSLPSPKIKIPQQPPADAPRQVAASARSSSSVMVQWQPPPAGQWNGDIKGYMIRYRLSGYAMAEWNEKNVSNEHARNALIEPLITWREYDIQVAAYNNRGLGVYSKPIEVTTLEGVPIQSPQNVHVDILNSTSIQISFDPPDQQMVPGVNLGYKIEFWKNGYFLDDVKRAPFKMFHVLPEFSRISYRVNNLEKYGHYNVTVVCYTAPGDGPRSEPLEVITLEDVPGPPSSINFEQILYNSVVVKWEPPTESNGIILKYVLQYWESKSSEKHRLEISAQVNSISIDGLIPSTRYSVDLQAVTNVGGGPVIEANFESSVTPELPGRPTSLTISDVGPRSVVLQFVPGFDGHSFIKRWIVEARIGSSSIFSTIYNTSLPKARSFTVLGLRPHTNYRLRLISENVCGKSAPSDPTRVFQTSQTFPENSPEKVYAEPISAHKIQISWTLLPLSHWNGDPIGYFIYTRTLSDRKFEYDNLTEWKEHFVSNYKANDFVLTDLFPFTSYQIKISAKNSFGSSNFSNVVVVTTYESAPSSAPTNIIATTDKKQLRVSVSWSEVDENFRNGRILGYVVRLEPQEKKLQLRKEVTVLGANTLSTIVSNLNPFTTYQVFVSAYNLIGESPKNNYPVYVTTAESLPGKPSNVSFVYKAATELRLVWQEPIDSNGRITGYSIRYWRADYIKEDAVNTQFPENVKIFSATSLTPDYTYYFGIKAENSVGWGSERLLEVVTTTRNAPLPVPSIPSRNVLWPQHPDKIYASWAINIDEQRSHNSDVSLIRNIEVQYRSTERKLENGEHFWETMPNLIEPDSDVLILSNLKPNTAYKMRIRFIGDFSHSSWSYESDWIKTLETIPDDPPDLLQVTPYESSSALIRWRALDQDKWNSDKISYSIFYKIYPSDDSFSVEDIFAPQTMEDSGNITKRSIRTNQTYFHVLKKLSSFCHYVVQIKTVNAIGVSKPSAPLFVYVGYSVPKRKINNLVSESSTSTSITLRWDNATSFLTNDESESIVGYKVRYFATPAYSSENAVDIVEEIATTYTNEITLTDLKKFTMYQISVVAYNRAGDGQPTSILQRTLEDYPEAVGPLIFHDILLSSVNVSWSPPAMPNGIIQGYVVNYRTYKMSHEFRKEIQEKTQLTYLLAENLEENTTYYFCVRAETSAGFGAETFGNVTTGYNEGAPLAVGKPSIILEHSTFHLRWTQRNDENLPVKGHFIQAKRVASALKPDDSNITDRMHSRNHRDATSKMKSLFITTASYLSLESDNFRPRHPIGEWFTLSSVLGPENEYRISYRQLEPSSYYVFRIFARNEIGIGLSSAESNQLFVPASLPEDPFWNQWWFLVIIGLIIVIVVFVFASILCFTSSLRNPYKEKKNGAFDTLQLSDGGIVSYELHTKHMKRAEELSRPNTHTSWISTGGDGPLHIDNTFGNSNSVGIYGSIANGLTGTGTAPAVSSMYQALVTDALPPDVFNTESNENYFGNLGGDLFVNNEFCGANDTVDYSTRRDLDNAHNNIYESRKKFDLPSPPLLSSEYDDSIKYQLKDFNAVSKFQKDGVMNPGPEQNSVTKFKPNLPHLKYEKFSKESNEEYNGDIALAEQNFALHYQSTDEASRTTWRRTRQQATQQQKTFQKGGVYRAMRRPASHYPNGCDPQQLNSVNVQSSASSSCLTQLDDSLFAQPKYGMKSDIHELYYERRPSSANPLVNCAENQSDNPNSTASVSKEFPCDFNVELKTTGGSNVPCAALSSFV